MNGYFKKMIFAAILAGVSGPALAQNLPIEEIHAGYRETGASKDWVGIYRAAASEEKGDICAVYSRPIETQAFKNGETTEHMRGEQAAFINWNDGAPAPTNGEVSFMIGAPVAEGALETHTLDVDGKSNFALIGIGDRLYVQPQDDDTVVMAIRAGANVTVTAELEDGTVTRDIYSLMGVVATTEMAKAGCK